MIWLLGGIDLLFVCILVAVGSIYPARARVSTFELERRAGGGDKDAAAALRQDSLAPVVVSIQRSLAAVLIVILMALSVATFGWWLGLFLMILIALEYGAIGRLSFVNRRAQKLYQQYEPQILKFAEKYQRGGFRLLLNPINGEVGELVIESRDDLLHALEKTKVFSGEEKSLLNHAITFKDHIVRDIMTPRSVIQSISKKELLGPLVLNDLHQTGHSRFPVIDSDLDHIVGMLYIQDLLVIGDKQRSQTVEKAMDPRVFYIRDDQSLWHALGAFLKTHHHLFVVVNEFRETVGLLSLEDVVESLIGQKIVGEFDVHDDLRKVAENNKLAKNNPAGGKDV